MEATIEVSGPRENGTVNDTTGRRQRWCRARPRRMGVLALSSGLVLLMAACGGGRGAATSPPASISPGHGRGLSATSVSGVLTASQSCFQYPASCYAAGPFRAAYGIKALLDRGIDGRGQTVVMPEAANQPPAGPPKVSDIRQDLARFDSLNGIPAARLRVVTALAGRAAPYLASFEEVEDVEIVHAVAPLANIVLVLVPPSAVNSPADFVKALLAFLRLAVRRGDVISISATIGEHFVTRAEAAQFGAVLRSARDHHVTVVAASGDTGAASDPHFGAAPVKEVSLPAADPLVLAAGGTSLALNPKTGAYSGEIAWNTSGGGYSHLYPRPSYQHGTTDNTAARGVPDVAADADSATGMALAIAGGNNYSLVPAGGTSAAAPLWAGVIALADQYAGRPLGFVNPALYRIGRSRMGRQAFHDVTSGDNSVVVVPRLITGYKAAPGWDPVTGWGSPDAKILVPLLAHALRAGNGR